MKRLRVRNNGFTMIERLIVVAIIGILAAIAIPQYVKYKEDAYVASMWSDCKSLQLAEEAYYIDNGKYTDVVEEIADFGFKGYSSGNDANITVDTDGMGYEIEVTSDKKDDKKVVHKSAPGTTSLEDA